MVFLLTFFPPLRLAHRSKVPPLVAVATCLVSGRAFLRIRTVRSRTATVARRSRRLSGAPTRRLVDNLLDDGVFSKLLQLSLILFDVPAEVGRAV